jgi:hypothetical protein
VDGEGTVHQLWERAFVYQDRGIFTSVETPQLALHFTVSQRGTVRLAITLSGRAFGDAVRGDGP